MESRGKRESSHCIHLYEYIYFFNYVNISPIQNITENYSLTWIMFSLFEWLLFSSSWLYTTCIPEILYAGDIWEIVLWGADTWVDGTQLNGPYQFYWGLTHSLPPWNCLPSGWRKRSQYWGGAAPQHEVSPLTLPHKTHVL